jgi:hypothetical protein
MIEYDYIINNSGTCSSSTNLYYRQCGWSNHNYNGVTRNQFVFNNGNGNMNDHYYIHSGHFQSRSAFYSSTSIKSYFESGSWKFAGLICIDVPGKIIFVLKQLFIFIIIKNYLYWVNPFKNIWI